MARGFGRFLRRNTIGLLALFIALGGTTYAATALPRNSVGARQLKKNAVVTAKIKKSAVTNPKIGRNAVTGAKVKDDSLTGADVLESGLGKVPAAVHADSASTATNATNATKATDATNATNATTATTAQNVVDNAIGSSKVADGSLVAADVASVSGSFTNDAPSIPANGCLTTAPGGLTGVLKGDVLLVTPPPEASFDTATTPILITATQSITDGFVRLHICNVSAAAFDPPAYTYRYMAFH